MRVYIESNILSHYIELIKCESIVDWIAALCAYLHVASVFQCWVDLSCVALKLPIWMCLYILFSIFHFLFILSVFFLPSTSS